MGFFKKIGEKVKRVASLKNAIGLVTGNYVGVAKDALRIATTNKPEKGQQATEDTTFFEQVPVIPDTMEKVLTVKGQEQSEKLINAIASKKVVQDTASEGTGFLSKVYLQAIWLKYKTWFIVALVSLGAFLLYWFGFREKNQPKRRSAKGRR